MQHSLSRNFASTFIFIAAAVAVAVLNVPAVNSAAKNGLYAVFGPVQQSLWSAGAGIYNFFGSFARSRSFAQENEKLRQQINELASQSAERERLKQENDFLRQGLNIELEKEFDLKLANVVAKSVEQGSLFIDKGSDNLVREGMPVITGQKALVGKVSKVYKNYSEVTLITNKDFSFDAKIWGDIDALVKGRGDSGAIVDFVPKDKELAPGAAVFTSTLGGIFPPGLLVGAIKDVAKNDVETFQTAGISLAFDINRDQRVFVVEGKGYPLGMGEVSILEKRQ